MEKVRIETTKEFEEIKNLYNYVKLKNFLNLIKFLLFYFSQLLVYQLRFVITNYFYYHRKKLN